LGGSPVGAGPVGGVVAIVASVQYWTLATLISPERGLPLSGDLYNFGVGGVRFYVLLLAVASTVLGVLALRRPALRTDRIGHVLVRLGLGVVAVPLGWL